MRASPTTNQKGEHVGYLISCPGCEHAHMFDSRWSFNGDLDKPTFRPSLLCRTEETRCHSFVTDGKIRFLQDCTHGLAGQTIDLSDEF